MYVTYVVQWSDRQQIHNTEVSGIHTTILCSELVHQQLTLLVFGIMTRIVYNRVNKAGSAAMIALLQFLAQRNNFNVIKEKHEHFFLDHEHLLKTLNDLPDNTVYVNHCNYIEHKSIDDYVWINIVREPIDRAQSLYYYEVSPIRPQDRVTEKLHQQNQTVNPCGCLNMEFDDCYRFYMQNPNCAHRLNLNSFKKFFADASRDPNHRVPAPVPVEDLFKRIRDRYLFVGILEEYELSIEALEKLLPRFFTGATAYLREQPHELHNTPQVNPLTNTTKGGAISTHV